MTFTFPTIEELNEMLKTLPRCKVQQVFRHDNALAIEIEMLGNLCGEFVWVFIKSETTGKWEYHSSPSLSNFLKNPRIFARKMDWSNS